MLTAIFLSVVAGIGIGFALAGLSGQCVAKIKPLTDHEIDQLRSKGVL
jgi:hypothetical protein